MEPVVSVQCILPENESSDVLHLSAGQFLTFGTCGCQSCVYGVRLRPMEAGHVSGRVIAFDDHWRLDNLSVGNRLFIEDLEHAGHLISVEAGRAGVVVAFEIARIVAGDVWQEPILKVFGPEPAEGRPPMQVCPEQHHADRTLDSDAAYFEVLQVLCEPRFSGANAPLPTSAAIAGKLTAKGKPTTPRAVDAHIDYLIEKLGLRPSAHGTPRRSWRKEALVTAAIRRGIVTQMG